MQPPAVISSWQTRVTVSVALSLMNTLALTWFHITNPLYLELSIPVQAAVYYVILLLVMRVTNSIGTRAALVGAISLTVMLVVAFCVIYPLRGAPQTAGKGSDQDDAVNILVDGLFRAGSPYRTLTYLSNPVSNLMGSAVLGAPFRWILGSAAWMNPVVLLVLIVIVIRRMGAKAGLLLSLLCFASPGFLMSYMVGSDYFTSAMIAAAASWWWLTASSRYQQVIAAILASVACTTRLHLLVVLVTIALISWVQRRWILPTLVAFASSAFLFLWWWLPDPSHFTPLGTTRAIGGSWGMIFLGVLWLGVVAIIVIRRLGPAAVSWLGLPVLAITAIASPTELSRAVAYSFWAVPLLVQRASGARPVASPNGASTATQSDFGPATED
jgi:hypothetical protein